MDAAWQLLCGLSMPMPPPPPPRRLPRLFCVPEDWWTRTHAFEGFVFSQFPTFEQPCFVCWWSEKMRLGADGVLACPRCLTRHGCAGGLSFDGVSSARWWDLVSRDSVCDIVCGVMNVCVVVGDGDPSATHAAVSALQVMRAYLAPKGPSLRLERARRVWSGVVSKLDAGDSDFFRDGGVLRMVRSEVSSLP